MKEFAVYKGDDFQFIGTMKEIAIRLGVKTSTVEHYRSPTHRKRRSYESSFIFVDLGKEDDYAT